MPGKHQFTRRPARSPGDFEPFFDWGEPDESPVVGVVPAEDLAERIVAACEEWQLKGGVLVRGHFGVRTVRVSRENLGQRRNERTGQMETVWGRLSGFYETQKHCCPLAPFLDGLPSRFHPVADMASVLAVDHLWVVGFIHGFDRTEQLAGKRAPHFNESLSYVDGHASGQEIAGRFRVLDLGWER